jgi:hypothetical protein
MRRIRIRNPFSVIRTYGLRHVVTILDFDGNDILSLRRWPFNELDIHVRYEFILIERNVCPRELVSCTFVSPVMSSP